MEKMTDHEKILLVMKRDGSITSAECFEKCRCTKLTTRISELRRLGYEFNEAWEKTEDGRKYKRYSLKTEATNGTRI